MNQLKTWITNLFTPKPDRHASTHLLRSEVRRNQADREFYLRLVETPPMLTPEADLLRFAEIEDEIGISLSAGDPKRVIADLLQFAEDAHDELRI